MTVLSEEMSSNQSGGIYHKVQVELTYNSNRIEGNKLSHDETRFIFETNTIRTENIAHNVDDIIETANHFRWIELIIKTAKQKLSEKLIKQLHTILKTGTADSRKSWFNEGEYKALPNEIGGNDTISPENVSVEINKLLQQYNSLNAVTFDDILDFHHRFESIHPFRDGNGRVGRLIMFKECLKHNIVPFIINDYHKMCYYRGIKEWDNERGFLRDSCLSCQDVFKKHLDYFRIKY